MRFLCHPENKGFVKGKNAFIKKLMVHGTEGDAVFFAIRSSVLVPFYMGRFDSYQGISQSDIKTTDGALIFISP